MKNLLAGILLFGFVLSANGATFNFSYDFGGNTVSGMFDGTQNNNLVEGISNISMYFNGVAFDGPLYATGWSNATSWTSGGAVASFDGLENNFFFSDVDYLDHISVSNYFVILTDGLANTAVTVDHDTGVDVRQGFDSGSWTLEAAQSSSVPESSSLYLLAFGLLGLFGTVRRKA